MMRKKLQRQKVHPGWKGEGPWTDPIERWDACSLMSQREAIIERGDELPCVNQLSARSEPEYV